MSLVLKNPQITTWNTSTGEDPGTLTLSYEVSEGPYQMLIVATGGWSSADDTRPSSAAQYGGVNTAQIDQYAGGGNTESLTAYYLINPVIGLANVTVALPNQSNNAGFWLMAFTIEGVDWLSPFGTVVKAHDTSTTPQAIVASEDGHLVFDVLVATANPTTTLGTGQSLIQAGNCGAWCRGFGSWQDGKTSVDMSWTLGSSQTWQQIAVPVRPFVDTGHQAIEYTMDMHDPDAPVLNRFGRPVPASEIRERTWGLLLGQHLPSSTVPADFKKHRRMFFIESLEYSGDDDAAHIVPARGQLEPNMLRKVVSKGGA